MCPPAFAVASLHRCAQSNTFWTHLSALAFPQIRLDHTSPGGGFFLFPPPFLIPKIHTTLSADSAYLIHNIHCLSRTAGLSSRHRAIFNYIPSSQKARGQRHRDPRAGPQLASCQVDNETRPHSAQLLPIPACSIWPASTPAGRVNRRCLEPKHNRKYVVGSRPQLPAPRFQIPAPSFTCYRPGSNKQQASAQPSNYPIPGPQAASHLFPQYPPPV